MERMTAYPFCRAGIDEPDESGQPASQSGLVIQVK
ncbi:hypothetical protein Mpal_1380 [Methanosphaerula palustris E1-9c]|uniref:Uncharacterized protein n=1 Tax=Methanosphaerula palustris (strain ATCC BAA-1556 / DSM 19958 / E1-9c) TaxID=521011 RepID=B8GHX0_METPE|nr:hypothetical protein Mpal_1380 [Methanosphaerula palustris E1-9c]